MKISKEQLSIISPCPHHQCSLSLYRERCHVANVSIHERREKMSLKGKNREWEREAHHYTVCQGGLLGRTASLWPVIGQRPALWPLIGWLALTMWRLLDYWVLSQLLSMPHSKPGPLPAASAPHSATTSTRTHLTVFRNSLYTRLRLRQRRNLQ